MLLATIAAFATALASQAGVASASATNLRSAIAPPSVVVAATAKTASTGQIPVGEECPGIYGNPPSEHCPPVEPLGSYISTTALTVDFNHPNDCSPIILHLFVDGHETVSTGAVKPGESDEVKVPWPNDGKAHELSSEGEGVAGECNNGEYLHIWEGNVEVTYTPPSGMPTLSIAGTTVAEPTSGTGTASFPVTLSEASTSTVTVDYTTQDGTGSTAATAPRDYEAASGTLTFSPGETSKTIPVTINHSEFSGKRTFSVALANAQEAEIATGEATGTIVGDALISGTVHDTYHKPIGGVLIKVSGETDEHTALSRTEPTNGTGEYSFELPPGEYTATPDGEPPKQNGGKMTVATTAGTVGGGSGVPAATSAPVCSGTVNESICKLTHLAAGETGSASFTYTYCASAEDNPNGKPLTSCPIVFIPGFLGSRIVCNTGELWPNLPTGPGTLTSKVEFGQMLLEPDGITNAGAPQSCSKDAHAVAGQAGLVGSAAGVDIYESLREYLNRIVSHVYITPEDGAYAFPFDWRKSPLIASKALGTYVDEVLAKTEASKVVLMAHSMGGLVLAGYLNDATNAQKVARAITLGTPYWGAPKSHTALLTAKSNTPKPELFGLDIFIKAVDLQAAARNMQGLYWLYPDANYGPWLKVNPNYGMGTLPSHGLKFGSWLSSSEIGPWITALGGTSQLETNALEGHTETDGFKTNGVPYQVVVGVGLPTVAKLEVSENIYEGQVVKVFWGSGDGTVPAVSATQGASEGGASPVPIDYECEVEHLALPGNPLVQAKIEGFLLRGEEVKSGAMCPYQGIETEVFKLPLTGAAFRASATPEGETVLTPSGSLTPEQAATRGLIQLVPDGSRTIIVTDPAKPATLQVTGRRLAVKVRSIHSAAKGAGGTSGPAHYYGPQNGTLVIGTSGSVTSHGKTVKAARPGHAPHTSARVTRKGHDYTVRLKATNGVAGIYYRIGKAPAKRYSKPLRLTKTQLKHLIFASVDVFGVWEKPKKAHIPR